MTTLAPTLIFPVEVAVVGVSWHQEQVAKCRVGMKVRAVHEPENPFDANAYAVYAGGDLVGHLPKAVAAKMVAGEAGELCGEIVRVGEGEVVGLRIQLWQPSGEEHASHERTSTPEETRGSFDVAVREFGADVGKTVRVRASGRVLGTLVSSGGGASVVRMTNGVEVRYPTSMVEVIEVPNSPDEASSAEGARTKA